MNYRLFAALMIVTALPITDAHAEEEASTMTKRPNVIIVITDDQGYGDLACHGNPWIKTPYLDQLHAESTRLTDFHVSPTCAPTRAALMTGRSCNRVGVWHTIMGRSLLRRDEVTMADVFRASGYATGMFGKWHLGDNYPFRPHQRGFDTAVYHGGGGIEQTPDHWGNDYFDDTYFRNGKPERHEGYCTDVWFDEAIRFIQSQAGEGKPFFCYLSTNAAHSPFRVPEKYKRMYAGNPHVPNADFYGMITNIDDNMARLDKTLADLGISDDTLLIFMTDNGSTFGEKNGRGFNADMRGQKGSQYDGGHRVPFFIRWPNGGIKPQLDVDHVTAHVDVLPTLTDMCGLQRPEGVEWEGLALTPLLRGEGEDWPDRTLVTDSQRIEMPEKWRSSAVMTDRWRLIDGQELYDMDADPEQQVDVAGEHADIVSRLRGDYESWWSTISARFDEYVRIVVGSDEENPTRLTSHDWHGDGAWKTWNQGGIHSGPRVNGYWAVDVEQAGRYALALRRWPREEHAPIRKRFIDVTEARMKIGEIDRRVAVAADDEEVVFELDLPAGPTKLETWFADDEGTSAGAYYVYVTRQ